MCLQALSLKEHYVRNDAIASVRNAFQKGLDVKLIRKLNFLGIHEKGRLLDTAVFEVMCQVGRNIDPDITNLAVKSQLQNCIGNSYARAKRLEKEKQRKVNLSTKYSSTTPSRSPRSPAMTRQDSTDSLLFDIEPEILSTDALAVPISSISTTATDVESVAAANKATISTVVATEAMANSEVSIAEFTM